MVRITLPADNEQIHRRYQLHLPTEEELRTEREREEAARSLRRAAEERRDDEG